MEKGLIHIYCGNGKGKTTAAVGLAARCAGSGGDVLFFQFLKDNTSSEREILKKIDRVTLLDGLSKVKFSFAMNESEMQQAKRFYTEKMEEIIKESEKYRLLVMDEIIAAANKGFIDEDRLVEFLKNKPYMLEVVLTGRNPSERLVDIADYVSEIKKIKHPFDKGIKARKGIEF
ncbi:MAG: cob(I)yrinic acid a,c-diamide adenosyltransferase [Clostridia bacterium]|nr:cob(I)yrinic acid a,c-diamide adenosyltransferase [Clostridia bacterium]